MLSSSSELLWQYLAAHSSPASDALKWLERETHLKVLMPNMLCGAVVGELLQTISRLMQPRHVLEIGTFTGYSAICLCAGLSPEKDALLHTIDINEELYDLRQEAFRRADCSHLIRQYYGKAADIIPTLPYTFDLVFIDADKQNYCRYYEQVLPLLKKNGIILADNVLWKGKVLYETTDKDTLAIQQFNDLVQNDPRVRNVMLPLRDGLTIIQKI